MFDKFLVLIETNNFAFLRLFRISHIIVKKFNFQFSIVFFCIKKKYIHLIKNVAIQICRSFFSKQFYIMTFFVPPIV